MMKGMTQATNITVTSYESIDEAINTLIKEGYSRNEITISKAWDYSFYTISGVKRG